MSESALMVATAHPPCAAWWGKLPSQGDFVGRRMPHALTMRWDEWLRNGMDQLRSDAGDAWASRFVQSPLWFFLCPTSILGQPLVGVIGPSADRIGRLFPLAIMATVENSSDIPTSDANIRRFLAGAREAFIDARRLPLSAQQLEARLTTLHWPFEPAHGVGQQPSIHSLLANLGTPANNAVQMPHIDWRTCMRAGSNTSVWWISPTPQHTHDEVVQQDLLHHRLFTRLFKGA